MGSRNSYHVRHFTALHPLTWANLAARDAAIRDAARRESVAQFTLAPSVDNRERWESMRENEAATDPLLYMVGEAAERLMPGREHLQRMRQHG